MRNLLRMKRMLQILRFLYFIILNIYKHTAKIRDFNYKQLKYSSIASKLSKLCSCNWLDLSDCARTKGGPAGLLNTALHTTPIPEHTHTIKTCTHPPVLLRSEAGVCSFVSAFISYQGKSVFCTLEPTEWSPLIRVDTSICFALSWKGLFVWQARCCQGNSHSPECCSC